MRIPDEKIKKWRESDNESFRFTAELVSERQKIMPHVFLIGPNGEKSAKCPRCPNIVLLKGRKQRSIGALCQKCRRELADESLEKHQREVDAGIPENMRCFEWPVAYLIWLDQEWWDLLLIGTGLEPLSPKKEKS